MNEGARRGPLRAADNQDKGGNCAPLALGGPCAVNLHSYWDTVALEAIEPDDAGAAGASGLQVFGRQVG